MVRSPTRMKSVDVNPALNPPARMMAAVMRTVVDLPLVPVTSATGIEPKAAQSTSSGTGSASGRQMRVVRP